MRLSFPAWRRFAAFPIVVIIVALFCSSQVAAQTPAAQAQPPQKEQAVPPTDKRPRSAVPP